MQCKLQYLFIISFDYVISLKSYVCMHIFLIVSHVVGFDIDDDALAVTQENLDDYDITSIDLVQCDLENPRLLELPEWHHKFDTVIMNPPFGTKKNKGIY